MCDSEHAVDEGEGGAATFDGKKANVKDKTLEWRAEGPIQKENKGTYEERA